MRPGEVIHETSFTIPTPIPPIYTDEGFVKEVIRWLTYKARKILREADIHAKIRATSPRQFIYRDLGDRIKIIDDDGNEIIVDKSGQIKMVIIGADLDEWNTIEIVFTFEGNVVNVKVIYAD